MKLLRSHLIKPTSSAFGLAYNYKYPAKYCASEGSFVFKFLIVFCYLFSFPK